MSTPADTDPLGYRGAALACPPFCPGDLERASAIAGAVVVPFAVDVGGKTFSLSLQASVTTAHVELVDLAAYAQAPGLTYSYSCAAAGFVDAASSVCANSSDPASYQCALGSGDACAPCPSNALCPGGSRLRPRPGYYATSETGAEIKVRKCVQYCEARSGVRKFLRVWLEGT